MLTKAELHRLRSLREKKSREELGLFVVEGEKVVAELLAVQGQKADVGGYYKPDNAKADAALRPSATLNGILAGV